MNIRRLRRRALVTGGPIDLIIDHWAIASLSPPEQWFQDGDMTSATTAVDPDATVAERAHFSRLPASTRLFLLKAKLSGVGRARQSERTCRFVVSGIPIPDIKGFGLQNDGNRSYTAQTDPPPPPPPDPDNPFTRWSVWGVIDPSTIVAGEVYTKTWEEYKAIIVNKETGDPLTDEWLSEYRGQLPSTRNRLGVTAAGEVFNARVPDG